MYFRSGSAGKEFLFCLLSESDNLYYSRLSARECSRLIQHYRAETCWRLVPVPFNEIKLFGRGF
jgi:hypothetical protein